MAIIKNSKGNYIIPVLCSNTQYCIVKEISMKNKLIKLFLMILLLSDACYADDVDFRVAIMEMRGKFLLSGTIRDQNNSPLDGVSFLIKQHNFNPYTLSLDTVEEEIIVNSSFSLQYENVKYIQIIASKQGYKKVKYSIDTEKVFKTKTDDFVLKVENGTINRPKTYEELSNIIGELIVEDNSINLVLRQNQGTIIKGQSQRFNLYVTQDEPLTSEEMDYAVENPKPSYFLKLIKNESALELSKLQFGCTNGKIMLVKTAPGFHEMLEAPKSEDKYSGFIDITDLKINEKLSFYTKTPNGFYCKGIGFRSWFKVAQEKGTIEAQLLIEQAAIQNDGSRYLDTDPIDD